MPPDLFGGAVIDEGDVQMPWFVWLAIGLFVGVMFGIILGAILSAAGEDAARYS